MEEKAPQFATVIQVAKAYKVDPNTIRNWCKKGIIRDAYKVGRSWRMPVAYATGEPKVVFDAQDTKKA